MICCCQRLLHHCRFFLSLRQANKAIIVASTKRPAYARKNLQLFQVNTIGMLSSLINYDAVLVMVVCDPRHLSFVAWWIRDPSFLCLGLLVRIPHSILITWQHNQRWRFQLCIDQQLESVYLEWDFFYDEYVVDPYVVKLRSKMKSSIEGHIFGPHLVKVRCVTKSSDKGHMFGPHLVEVHSETKSSNKGHILDHIWLKSAVWQSPPTRGTIWATFGRSPMCDKVLWWGARFGPHLSKARCVTTKSSNEGHNLGHIWSKSAAWQSPLMKGTVWTTFGQNPQWDKVLRQGASFFCHIWPLSTAWQLRLMANHGYHSLATFDQSLLCDTSSNEMNCFPFYARFGQCQLINMQLSLVIVQFFECL